MRYELSDSEWATIKPFLPNKSRGVRRVNDRRVLNGIFWVLPEFWSQVQRGYANRICTSLPSSLRIAWKGVLKPRHFLGVRLAVMTMS